MGSSAPDVHVGSDNGAASATPLPADPAAEVVDELFRQLAVALRGRSLGEVARQRRSLFGGGFASPVLVGRDSALEHNLRQMDDYRARTGVTLIPHGKTAMAPQLVARQLRRGGRGDLHTLSLSPAGSTLVAVLVPYREQPPDVGLSMVDSGALRLDWGRAVDEIAPGSWTRRDSQAGPHHVSWA